MPLQYLKNPETQQMGFYDTDTKRWISDVNPLVSNVLQGQSTSQLNRAPSTPWDQISQTFQGNPALQFQPVVGTEQDFDVLKGTTNSPFSTQTAQGGAPTSLEDLDRMVKSGELTDMNLINQYELQFSNQQSPQTAGEVALDPNSPGTGIPGGEAPMNSTPASNPYNQRPWWSSAMNFAGSDLSTEAYSLGMRLGQERGTPGRGLGIAGSAGAFALGATRDLLAGLSTQKMNNYINDWYQQNRQKTNYTPDSQTTDNNYLGGQPFEKGGTIKMQQGGEINPYYQDQLKLYSSYNNPQNFTPRGETRTLEGEELDRWYQTEVSNLGNTAFESGSNFVGGFKPKSVVIDEYGNYYPTYEKPSKSPMTSTPQGPSIMTQATSQPSPTNTKYFKSNISYSSNPNAQASLNIPYLSEEERLQIVEDFKNIKTEKDYKNSPYYQRYGQNAFKQGVGYVSNPAMASMETGGQIQFMQDGSTVGYRMPLDGSQLPENKQAAPALFPGQYGDINFFAEGYNRLKEQMENSATTEPYFVDADGNLIPRSIDPNNLTSPYVSMRESRQQARDLNRRIRQNDLPYQKVQKDAFYNPDGNKEVASFKDGGEYKKGQYIEFMYGGKKVSGNFDRIENGKIYLQ